MDLWVSIAVGNSTIPIIAPFAFKERWLLPSQCLEEGDEVGAGEGFLSCSVQRSARQTRQKHRGGSLILLDEFVSKHYAGYKK